MLISVLECADKELKSSEQALNTAVALAVTSSVSPDGVILECAGDDTDDDDTDDDDNGADEEPSIDLHDVISE